MRVAIGADREGYILKEAIINHLRAQGIAFFDFGCYELERADYAVYAQKVGEAVASGEYDRGILIDASGVGVCIVANKIKEVRAAQVGEVYSARMTRRHNDANVLCFGGRITGAAVALACVDVWLKTPFDGDGHAERLAELDAMRAVYRKDEAPSEG
nr:ribose 5-phosphate isomerase B [Maliibacterium massiliense]